MFSMAGTATPTPRTAAWRQARRAWRLLYSDSQRCTAEADAALANARRRGDVGAEGWARLARGFNLIWYATPDEAMHELNRATAAFAATGDRAGELLAEVGLARSVWRRGDYRASLQRVLRLRDGVVLLPSAPALAMRELARLPQPFTTSHARQALGTTRRVAIPLLEHLDARGWTRRRDAGHREVLRGPPTTPPPDVDQSTGTGL